jgi:hypothetical protein
MVINLHCKYIKSFHHPPFSVRSATHVENPLKAVSEAQKLRIALRGFLFSKIYSHTKNASES